MKQFNHNAVSQKKNEFGIFLGFFGRIVGLKKNITILSNLYCSQRCFANLLGLPVFGKAWEILNRLFRETKRAREK